jgi:predicted DNA-binding transcriptional regulator YafY
MKSERLLSALLLLQAHGRLTGREMSRRLEVSMRTVHRDMDALSAAGVPVLALRGAAGGWQLDPGWRTQVPGLDDDELRALLMSQPRIAGDARLHAAAQSALGKLMAALPAAMRERAASIRQRLHVDTTGWRGTGENLAMLPVVQDAVARDRKLAISYWKANRTRVERTVEPLGLVAKGAAWYLFANTPQGYRTFRVSRIAEAKLLDQTFERPRNFDLAAAWRASTDQFSEGRTAFEATLRLERRAAEWIKMWQSVSHVEPSAGEWVTMRVKFHHEDEASFVAKGLGIQAEVIGPPRLRKRVAQEISEMGRRLG